VKALLDEQLSPEIAILLCKSGYDVVAVTEQGDHPEGLPRGTAGQRVRTQRLFRMLSYRVSGQVGGRLGQVRSKHDGPATGGAARTSPVPAQRKDRAAKKARTKAFADATPACSLHSLLGDLATIWLNKITPTEAGLGSFEVITRRASLQCQARDLLGGTYRFGVP